MKNLNLSLCSLLFFTFAAFADTPEAPPHLTGDMYTFQLENDSRNIGGPGTDKAYTNGLKLSYGYAENKVPRWAPVLTSWSDLLSYELAKSDPNYNISLGQKLFTPKDTQALELNQNDQPYAAWLYLGFGANFKSGAHGHSVEVDVGTIGSNALGEQAQNTLHRGINVKTAKGWGNQLRNEPTLELSLQERWRVLRVQYEDNTLADLVPYAGLAVGNVLDSAQLGGMVRFGYHLPDDFGPSRPSTLGSDAYMNPRGLDRAGHQFGIYGYWGISGSGVAHNIFLDGNTFTSSPHVTRIPFVYNVEEGISMRLYGFYLAWKFVTVSPEFKERKETNSFASVQLTYSIPQ